MTSIVLLNSMMRSRNSLIGRHGICEPDTIGFQQQKGCKRKDSLSHGLWRTQDTFPVAQRKMHKGVAISLDGRAMAKECNSHHRSRRNITKTTRISAMNPCCVDLIRAKRKRSHGDAKMKKNGGATGLVAGLGYWLLGIWLG